MLSHTFRRKAPEIAMYRGAFPTPCPGKSIQSLLRVISGSPRYPREGRRTHSRSVHAHRRALNLSARVRFHRVGNPGRPYLIASHCWSTRPRRLNASCCLGQDWRTPTRGASASHAESLLIIRRTTAPSVMSNSAVQQSKLKSAGSWSVFVRARFSPE